MTKRTLYYFCALVFREWIIGLPAIAMEGLALLLDPGEIRRGIRVIGSDTGSSPAFTILVKNALDLAAVSDPVRFKRIVREIRTIVDAPAPAGSTYSRPFKLCSVDLRCFFFPSDPAFADALLASVFVREATHAYITSRGILRTEKNRTRFDRLCIQESEQFLRRLGMSNPVRGSQLINITSPQKSYLRLAAQEVRDILSRDSQAQKTIWNWVKRNEYTAIPQTG